MMTNYEMQNSAIRLQRNAKEEFAASHHNLLSLFEVTAKRCAQRVAAKTKRDGAWQELLWSDLASRVRDLANGWVALGVKPGDRVALIGDTRIEWLVTYLSLMGAGAIAVPIYQSNKAADCEYIIKDSGARWIALDADSQAAKIESIRAHVPEIQAVVRMAEKSPRQGERGLSELEELGRTYKQSHPDAYTERSANITSESLACVLYTSGTTGNPKGVMLTHGNWVYEAESVCSLALVCPSDTVFFILPLAHSFAQVVAAAWLHTGCVAAFAESIEKLVDNAGEVRPTVIPAVPRIFEKAYANVVQTGLATGGVKGHLFKMAMASFDQYAAARDAGRSYNSIALTLARVLVFPKLAAALNGRFGGRLRIFVSGGAPLSPKIAYFFDQLGITIIEGYGLTETSAAACANRLDHNAIGTVGPAVPGTEIMIAQDGEILIRGGGVMKGYWHNDVATAEVMSDGFFATGDIGHLDANSCLTITDRKKDIIVTAAGKNVAPQNLENELKVDSLISQVMVHGDKRKFLCALITLNEEAAHKWAEAQEIPPLPLAELVQQPLLVGRVQKTIDAVNARQASYATIKKFAILAHDFSIESGELTPTLKVKRKVCNEKYRAILDGFYADA